MRKLKNLAQITYGIGLELDRLATSGTPIISLPNVTIDGTLQLDDLALTPLLEREKKELLLRKGDLLFNWRNGSSDHVGKTALFDVEGEFTHVSFFTLIEIYLIRDAIAATLHRAFQTLYGLPVSFVNQSRRKQHVQSNGTSKLGYRSASFG